MYCKILVMKKILIIFSATLITLAVFILCDFLFFNHMALKELNITKSFGKYVDVKEFNLPEYSIKLNSMAKQYEERKTAFRPVMNPNSKENSIIIFGCSFAYGYVFDNNQTISYVMSKYSTRPIYNRALNCWGIQHAIYQLKDKDFYNIIKTKPKYIFFVLIGHSGHFERLYYTAFPNIIDKNYYLTYKQKGNDLTERKPFLNLYYNFAIFRHIQNKIIKKWVVDKKFYENPNKENFGLFILHFKTMNKLIKTLWGGAEDNKNGEYPKLIILTFENTKKEYWQEELEKDGITVIDIADTIGIHYINDLSKGFFEPELCPHPNGKLWELLVPKLKEMYPDL